MKLIKITQDFRDSAGTFYAGEIRMVEEEKAGYFKGNGWACEVDETPAPKSDTPPADVTLQVQSGSHKSKTRI